MHTGHAPLITAAAAYGLSLLCLPPIASALLVPATTSSIYAASLLASRAAGAITAKLGITQPQTLFQQQQQQQPQQQQQQQQQQQGGTGMSSKQAFSPPPSPVLALLGILLNGCV